jgi:phage baseplate assembly protein W
MSNKFIGTGITFPLLVNTNGGINVVGGTELLKASIKTILYWPINQRFFNETFGSKLHAVLEEPNDNISKTLIRTFIFEVLNKWEKRIITKDVSILSSDYKTVNLEITYIIRSTRTEETMVFPFYKEIIY